MSRLFNKIRLKRTTDNTLPQYVYINDKKVSGVSAISFSMDLDSVPTCELTLACLDGFEFCADVVNVHFSPQTIEEAKTILRNAGIKEV